MTKYSGLIWKLGNLNKIFSTAEYEPMNQRVKNEELAFIIIKTSDSEMLFMP